MKGKNTKKRVSNFGRRTGLDVKAGKRIRLNENGMERFDDYWTSSEDNSDSSNPSPMCSSFAVSNAPRMSSFIRNQYQSPRKELPEKINFVESPTMSKKQVRESVIPQQMTGKRKILVKGRRTGTNIIAGKKINEINGIENFDNYWTDSSAFTNTRGKISSLRASSTKYATPDNNSVISKESLKQDYVPKPNNKTFSQLQSPVNTMPEVLTPRSLRNRSYNVRAESPANILERATTRDKLTTLISNINQESAGQDNVPKRSGETFSQLQSPVDSNMMPEALTPRTLRNRSYNAKAESPANILKRTTKIGKTSTKISNIDQESAGQDNVSKRNGETFRQLQSPVNSNIMPEVLTPKTLRNHSYNVRAESQANILERTTKQREISTKISNFNQESVGEDYISESNNESFISLQSSANSNVVPEAPTPRALRNRSYSIRTGSSTDAVKKTPLNYQSRKFSNVYQESVVEDNISEPNDDTFIQPQGPANSNVVPEALTPKTLRNRSYNVRTGSPNDAVKKTPINYQSRKISNVNQESVEEDNISEPNNESFIHPKSPANKNVVPKAPTPRTLKNRSYKVRIGSPTDAVRKTPLNYQSRKISNVNQESEEEDNISDPNDESFIQPHSPAKSNVVPEVLTPRTLRNRSYNIKTGSPNDAVKKTPKNYQSRKISNANQESVEDNISEPNDESFIQPQSPANSVEVSEAPTPRTLRNHSYNVRIGSPTNAAKKTPTNYQSSSKISEEDNNQDYLSKLNDETFIQPLSSASAVPEALTRSRSIRNQSKNTSFESFSENTRNEASSDKSDSIYGTMPEETTDGESIIESGSKYKMRNAEEMTLSKNKKQFRHSHSDGRNNDKISSPLLNRKSAGKRDETSFSRVNSNKHRNVINSSCSEEENEPGYMEEPHSSLMLSRKSAGKRDKTSFFRGNSNVINSSCSEEENEPDPMEEPHSSLKLSRKSAGKRDKTSFSRVNSSKHCNVINSSHSEEENGPDHMEEPHSSLKLSRKSAGKRDKTSFSRMNSSKHTVINSGCSEEDSEPENKESHGNDKDAPGNISPVPIEKDHSTIKAKHNKQVFSEKAKSDSVYLKNHDQPSDNMSDLADFSPSKKSRVKSGQANVSRPNSSRVRISNASDSRGPNMIDQSMSVNVSSKSKANISLQSKLASPRFHAKSNISNTRSSIDNENEYQEEYNGDFDVVPNDIDRPESTSVNAKSKHKKRKKKLPLVTEQQNEPENGENQPRRSKRTRFPPLERWRNQHLRVNYKEGDIASVEVEEGFSPVDIQLDIIRKRQEQYKKSRQKNNSKKEKLHDNTMNLNQVKIDLNKTEIYNSITGGAELLYLYRPHNTVLWSAPLVDEKQAAYTIAKIFNSELVSFGFVDIDVGKEKKKQQSPEHNIAFTVVKGNRLKMTIHKTSFNLKELDFIVVPAGNTYSIKNNGKTNTLLSFSAFKTPLFDYQFSDNGKGDDDG